MQNFYYILSFDASDILEGNLIQRIEEYKKNKSNYYKYFNSTIDYSLDLIYLEKIYKKYLRRDFAKNNNNKYYTDALILVKFNKTCLLDKKKLSLKEVREKLYNEGFTYNNEKYIRYKRSSGSAREGNCLFINEKLYKEMMNWSRCGLTSNNVRDLSAWESYISLSLSAIIDTMTIPLNSILFVPDFKSIFKDKVVNVSLEDKELQSKIEEISIKNDIWDGESLIDESLFINEYEDKHMFLLRNKFFKSCAFRTKLQKWFKDKNITIDKLKERGFVTKAEKIEDIKFVTTPNSLKYLKFTDGNLNDENIYRWLSMIDEQFGIVKYDKRTKYFDGRMVRTSYQFLNTLGFNNDDCSNFLEDSFNYMDLLRNDIDFFVYHFTKVIRREQNNFYEKEKFTILDNTRYDVLMKLMSINSDFSKTAIYRDFRNEVIKSFKNDLKQGRILLEGTNATIFGNGPEFLKYLSGEFNEDNINSILGKNEIYCKRFIDNEQLLCYRSPHITMGNLYYAKNKLDNDIWDYFDLGNNIVCINAIGENIQQCLNGCDYDSDTLFITNDQFCINKYLENVKKYPYLYYIPTSSLFSSLNGKINLVELDYTTSQNRIGEIVNLSQVLNSYLWDIIEKNNKSENVEKIYLDICKLSILSGVEIDRAKRSYEDLSPSKELKKINNKYNLSKPEFFKSLFDKRKEEDYANYKTTMQHIYDLVNAKKYNLGRNKVDCILKIGELINSKGLNATTRDKESVLKAIEIIDEYFKKNKSYFNRLNDANKTEKETTADINHIIELKQDLILKVQQKLNNKGKIYKFIKLIEDKSSFRWTYLLPIADNEYFKDLLIKKENISRIEEYEQGEYSLYGKKYTKISSNCSNNLEK